MTTFISKYGRNYKFGKWWQSLTPEQQEIYRRTQDQIKREAIIDEIRADGIRLPKPHAE